MTLAAPDPPTATIDDFIRPYEEALDREGFADLVAFAPAIDHPLRIEVLCELVRIELEHAYRQGQPRPLGAYQERFPELFRDRHSLLALAFEDYRLRCQAGLPASREEYAQRFGVETQGWPAPPAPKEIDAAQSRALEEVRRRHPGSAARLSRILTSFPSAGTTFAGFRLLEELGRGAFGRVYLARQDDLARRLVALKITADLGEEPQTLAQLQHTNIVPIHSLHKHGPFRALCMPYFGSTTLGTILQALRGRPSLPNSGEELLSSLSASTRRPLAEAQTLAEEPATGVVVPLAPSPTLPRVILARMSYVDAVLWLGARLADGLAHAHERGILHHDLKPANILLTDEGQPMLLDFNLACDLKTSRGAAQVGGTLPYMAPEHLQAFWGGANSPDGRCDIYSLGVILFELLSGHLPYPPRQGPLDDVLPRMIADREARPPRLRKLNPAVSPAIEAIVNHCLHPDPARRYQTARQLQEDLDCHLRDQALRHTREPSWRERVKKWARRHPRLTSGFSVALAGLCGLLLLAAILIMQHRQLDRYRQEERLDRFQAQIRAAHLDLLDRHTGRATPLDQVEPRLRALLDESGSFEQSAWKYRAVNQDLGELLLLWARVLALHAQAGPIDRRGTRLNEALAINERAEPMFGAKAPRVLFRQRADFLTQLGRLAEAQSLQEQLGKEGGSSPRERALQAAELAFQGRHRESLELLREITREEPTWLGGWIDRAIAHERLGQEVEAEGCYSTCLALAPDFTALRLRRGLCSLRRQNYSGAETDFSAVLQREPEHLEARVNRSLAWLWLNQAERALLDLDATLERTEVPPRVHFIRAHVRLLLKDPAGAQADVRAGLSKEPADEEGWLARGMAHLGQDPRKALADFDRALLLEPRSRGALRNRAHVLAEHLSQPREAIRSLDRLLSAEPDYAPALAGRAVLLARLGRRTEAHRDAERASRSGPEAIYQAACAYALTSRQVPEDHIEATRLLAEALRQGYGREHLSSDRDLDPLRNDPEFRRLCAKYASKP